MQRSLTVVVFSPMAGGFYYGGVLTGITREVAAAGGHVVLVQTKEADLSKDVFADVPIFEARTAWEHAAGFVSLASSGSASYHAELVATGKPLVLAGNLVDGVDVPAAMPDNVRGVRSAVDHLIEHGHTRIGFLSNCAQFDMRERRTAYVESLAARGFAPAPELIFAASDNTHLGGQVAAAAVAEAVGQGMTALITGTDRNALGLMESLPRFGIRPGRDLAVIGFDDIPLARRSKPSLSTVSQQFSKLGGLAGRLLLAQLRGQYVAPGRHITDSAFIPRESCGCHSRSALEPSTATPSGSAKDALFARAAEIVAAEHEAGSSDDRVIASVIEDAVRVLESAATGDAPLDGTALEASVARIFEGKKESNSPSMIVALLVEYGQAFLAQLPERSPHRGAVQSAVVAMAHAFLVVQADNHSEISVSTETTMREQYEIDVRLLRRDAGDPRSLAWLALSSISAGCLALWDGSDGELRISGIYDPSNRLTPLVGTRSTAATFPPPELLHVSAAADGDVVYVVPVKARDRDWGLLAVTGGIDAKLATGRETLNHWAALLAIAFEQEALLDDVRRSEERYALAAQAANDGLWDWDVATGIVYYSPRWAATLGYAPSEVAATPQAWFSLVHPEDIANLRAAIEQRLAGDPTPMEIEHRVRTGAGRYRWMLCRATAVNDNNGPAVRVVGSLTDIDARKSLEEQLRHGALHDELTGLPNRALLINSLTWALERSHRQPHVGFAVLFLDLDDFKVVNDSLGHHIGDRLLVEVGNRLRSAMRSIDIAARVGGDEFVLLLLDIDPDDVPRVVTNVQARLAEPFDLDGHQVVVTASTGIALSRADYVDADDVLRDADIAMYRAKAAERGSYEMFDTAMRASAVQRLNTEVELRRALDQGEFEVHYQPIVDLETCSANAFEALVRWRHPERGLLAPGEFLPVAEETGLVVRLGRWIIDQTCRQIEQWRTSYDGDVSVSVNVSNREFWHAGLLEHVVAALARHHLAADSIKLEITEGVIMHSPELARGVMQELHANGLQLHIDDFGTGYSSLHALHRFPIQGLKIDKSFVDGMGGDRKTRELVNTIVAMGRNLGVDVVAEGVETAQQKEWLRSVGCRFGQGYWFARPVDGAAAGLLLGRVMPLAADASASAIVPALGYAETAR